MKFCDKDGFGPFNSNGSFISPCFSQSILEPLLYSFFIIFSYRHYKSIQTLPKVLDFRHSSPKFKLKICLSALQTVYPLVLTIFIVGFNMKSSFGIARFLSYYIRGITWFISTVLIVLEYQRALPQHRNLRLMWFLQLLIDFFACLVPHGGDKELLRFLSVINFLISSSICVLSVWNDDIKFSLFNQNKESDNNFFWNDFHDTSRSRSTTPEKDYLSLASNNENDDSFLMYGLENENVTFDNLKVTKTDEDTSTNDIMKKWLSESEKDDF